MSSDVTRPIILLGETALNSLRLRAEAVLDAWAGDWMTTLRPRLRAAAAEVSPRPPHDEVFEHWAGERGSVWFRCEAEDDALLGRTVVGPGLMTDAGCADDWIAEVVVRARQTRNRALCTALMGEPLAEPSLVPSTELPGSLHSLGSGAVHLSCSALGLSAIAAAEALTCLEPVGPVFQGRVRPALTPLNKALGGCKARLSVPLGSVEIALDTLLNLHCGDVLRLPQRLGDDLTVYCEGKPLAKAALGEQHGRKGVQLLAAH